jgi:hypothetical protein
MAAIENIPLQITCQHGDSFRITPGVQRALPVTDILRQLFNLIKQRSHRVEIGRIDDAMFNCS